MNAEIIDRFSLQQTLTSGVKKGDALPITRRNGTRQFLDRPKSQFEIFFVCPWMIWLFFKKLPARCQFVALSRRNKFNTPFVAFAKAGGLIKGQIIPRHPPRGGKQWNTVPPQHAGDF